MRRSSCMLGLAFVHGLACSGGAPSEPVTPAPAVVAPVPSEPVPAPAPPAAAAPPADRPELACTSSDDCELVTAPCGAIEAVNRAHASEVQARNDAIASVTECAQLRPPVAVEPVCNARRCTTWPLPHPELRACRRERDCIPFTYGCQWTTVARASEVRAREVMPVGPECPGIMPIPPDVRCTFGFCRLARASD